MIFYCKYLSCILVEIFDDDFIDYLYDLVEQTKYMQDESFNYSVIKFIVRHFCVLLFTLL